VAIRFGNGSATKIDLVVNMFSIGEFARCIRIGREEFLSNSAGYMRVALRKFEEIAVRDRDPGRGVIQIITQNTRAVSATSDQTGLDQCLHFVEDDYSARIIRSLRLK
jgi:hypothetical protein